MKNREVYLDYAATTPVAPEVKEAMEQFWSEKFGNPGSFNSKGLEASKALEKARLDTANCLNCYSEEIIFTGSGTESVNLAIKGITEANKQKGKHIITTKVEHKAVLETCKFLEKQGFEITYLQTDKYGLVTPDILEKAIKKDTVLISIIFANNEIGTINPIKELAEIAKKHNVLFHTDACQAGGAIKLDVKDLNVDLLTLNGSKIYGPKGIGCLYIRKGVKLQPVIHGGGQEFGLRSGTENVPLVVGFAKALELAQQNCEKESKRLTILRDKLIKGILDNIPKTVLNGHPERRLPNNVNISFLDVEGESLLLQLDENKIQANTGSACTSKTHEPSHVLIAIGLKKEIAHGSIRFSLGKFTTEEDIDYVLEVLPKLVESLRNISPVKIEV